LPDVDEGHFRRDHKLSTAVEKDEAGHSRGCIKGLLSFDGSL
jgi:hypothetical protein